MTLAVSGLSRRYGSEAALADIDIAVAAGEFLALLGPSGAGKTTLLRLIAGLDRPDSGTILIDGVDAGALTPRDRRIGFVFQNYALFRHMTVARNIAFGLTAKPRRHRPSRAQIASRVEELLGLMQLSGLGDRFPAQLSGGQRQRVALARALAVDPRVLLLDEPFGALDAKVRGELREWLRELQRTLGLTTVFVTHDQHEAFQLADRVAILNAGHLEQIGSPADLLKRPATPFVRAFLGAAGGHSGHCASSAALQGIRDATAFAEPAPRALPALDPSAFVVIGRERPTHGAVARQMPVAVPKGNGEDPTAGRRPSWTPCVVGVLPDVDLAADLPAVAAGELWLIVLPGAGGKPSSLERDALTRANVIVYDRGLTDVVAEVMPLGGYAEPTDGDGLARSLQFVRDGWSVVRLIAPLAPDDPNAVLGALGRRLREAGAFPGWRLRRFSENDGRWLCGCDERLDNAGLVSGHSPNGTREVIVISISGGTVPAFCAVASNGPAG